MVPQSFLFSSIQKGCKILENGYLFKELLQTPNFRITVVDDADTVELCGALKVRLVCGRIKILSPLNYRAIRSENSMPGLILRQGGTREKGFGLNQASSLDAV